MKKLLFALAFASSLSCVAQSVLLDTDYPAVAPLTLVSEGGALSQEVKGPTEDTIFVESIAELRMAAQMSGHIVKMAPGTYTIEGTMPNDVLTIIDFSGSNNTFILDDVSIILPTSVLAAMGPGDTHAFASYRIDGANLTFLGGHFENIGDDQPYKSLAEFEIHNNNVSFIGCTIIIRGSAPYGYGDMYGKGSGSAVGLYKHSAMSILGDNVLVDSCDFKVYSYGHGIHIHGSQNTVLRNITMEGILRLTDEIYEETSGPAFDYDFTIQYPDWYLGLPIPKGEMLSLTEDGIRAYLDGDDINGDSRRTGTITVENCYVDKMRGGITLTLASAAATVTNCTVVNCDHAYSLPSSSVVRNCKGNMAYGPLLSMPYSNKNSADIELELIASDTTMGTHPMAELSGSNHKITFTCNEEVEIPSRSIMIGNMGDRYNESNSTAAELLSAHKATGFTVVNSTSMPIVLSEYSSSCTVSSDNDSIINNGTSNIIQ